MHINVICVNAIVHCTRIKKWEENDTRTPGRNGTWKRTQEKWELKKKMMHSRCWKWWLHGLKKKKIYIFLIANASWSTAQCSPPQTLQNKQYFFSHGSSAIAYANGLTSFSHTMRSKTKPNSTSSTKNATTIRAHFVRENNYQFLFMIAFFSLVLFLLG